MNPFLGDLRAFGAAARKELRITRRYPTLMFGMFFWPILLPAVYVVQAQAFSGNGDPRTIAAFAERAGTSQVAGFVFIGWAMYMWLSQVLWGPGLALRTEQLRGSLEAVFLTPSSRLVALFGPSTAALAPSMANLAIMAVAARVIFGVDLAPEALARAAVVIVLTIPAMYGIGSLFASAILRFGEVGGVVQLVRGIFTLACGVTFPLVMLPDWARAVALTLPPTYFVADLRRILLAGASLADVWTDLLVLAVLGAIVCGLSVWAFKITELSARRVGMLGRY